MKRVAIGGLHTECSSYSPLQQVRGDFTRTDGAALTAMVPLDLATHGIEAVPLLHERSVPGGPVAAECFEAQWAEFMAALERALPLDGVLLLMHGAMFVPGIDDPEGSFVAEVRRIVGPQAVIAGAFDLHGQMTAQIADSLDIFAAYRTAPHVDVAETRARATRMLVQALNDGPRPLVCWRAVPLLVPGEMSSTFVEPCGALYADLPSFEASPGILDANLMIGYVWADSPRATAASVVTALHRQAGERAAEEIADRYWSVRDRLDFDMEAMPLEAALDVLPEAPSILADSGDNPTAGGVGDRADVLAAVQRRARSGTLFAGIADPAAVAAIEGGAEEIMTGGSLGGGGPTVRLKVERARLAADCAVVESGALTIVLTRRRRPFHDLADFAALGLDLVNHPLLVVKSGYLSLDLRALPRRQVMALTDGAVSQDLARLENLHRPRPTWPFQL